VRIEGPVVLQLQAAFITDWYAETDILLARANNQELQLQTVARGTTLCQILPSGPGFDNDNNLKLFTSLIHAAKSHITIVNPYFIPDDSLVTAITSAAQRGVTVTMINSEIIDQAMVGYAQRSYFEELLKAGVQLYQYNTPILLHSKFLTIDESVAVIGSSNLDMRSFQLDLEVTLLAYDKHIVEKLQSVTKTYLKRSKQLSLKTWNKRPLQKKLFENLARLTSAVQ
jgi:cardiolipin synthase